jgi:hypothetical protein
MNGVTNSHLAETNLYVGGTIGKSKQLVLDLPKSVQEAIDKGLLEYKLTYSSSDRRVAFVLNNGKINALRPGTTTITALLEIGDRILEFKTTVIVKKAYIEFISVSDQIEVGTKVTLQIAVYGYSEEDIIWGTNKKGISVVGANEGKTTAVVTAKSKGKEYVTVKIVINNKTYRLVKTEILVIDKQ